MRAEEKKDAKASIYGLTREKLIDWAVANDEKKVSCNTSLGLALS